MGTDAPALSIRPLKSWEEFLAAEELQRSVWQMPDFRDVVPANLMVATSKNGGLVLGAFDGDGRLAGFAYSFVGIDRHGDRRRVKHHSHMLAVLPEFRSRGIGIQLKFKQREGAAALGIDLMTWTYDPLQALNANLNLVHLGAIARQYVANAYGEMTDGLNAGLPSDRFQVEWWLKAPRVKACAAGRSAARNWDEWLAAGARPVFQVAIDARGLPHVERENELSGERLLLEIPADLGTLKSASLDLAREWRGCTRDVFERAFAAGFAATDFVFTPTSPRRAAYVLSSEPVQTGEGPDVRSD
jgi:predicted GNAT superfamily acetyltransferase